MAPRRRPEPEPFNPMVRRVLLSVADYDPEIKARVLPWAHRLHAWAGLVFIYDDPAKKDLLIYMASNTDGQGRVHIHRTSASVTLTDLGEYAVDLGTQPNPETDEVLARLTID